MGFSLSLAPQLAIHFAIKASLDENVSKTLPHISVEGVVGEGG